MTQEKFDALAKTRKELVEFLQFTKDTDFDGVAAHIFLMNNNVYSFITNKEIVKGIVDYVQTRLNEINKIIEDL